MRLILGSQSPQRKEILQFFSHPFEQISPSFDERLIAYHGDPIDYVQTLSIGKSNSLISHHPESVILTADTVVYSENKIFNKPHNEEEGFEMLCTLQGGVHTVYTAVTAAYRNEQYTECASTKVHFHSLNEMQLQLYHKAFRGIDKAGGYGIQMAGSIIVKKLEGCFYNVMGLPLSATQNVLQKVGIDLWHYLCS